MAEKIKAGHIIGGLVVGGLVVGGTTLIYALTRKAEAVPEVASCYGTVVDADTGYPVVEATVILDAFKDTTITDGTFFFTEIPSGKYQLGISKSGYKGVTMSITLEPGEARDLGIIGLIPVPIVIPKASIFGRVVDADTGLPISGILVTIGSWSDTTDYNGFFNITDIEPGTYASINFTDPLGRYEPLTKTSL